MREQLHLMAYLLLLIAMPCAAALGRVHVRQDCLALGYRMSVQQQRREALRAELRQAELQRARGRAPAVLMDMAKRLQLAPPRPGHSDDAPKAKARLPRGPRTASSATAEGPASRAKSH